MTSSKCTKCGSMLREVLFDFESGPEIVLRFLICNNCGLIRAVNTEEVMSRLKFVNSQTKYHLDRFVLTLTLVPWSSRKLKVLDIGTFPGFLTRMIKQLFNYEMYGLDSSSICARWEDFQEYVSYMRQKGISIRDCDVDKDRFPFLSETFDLVLMTEVLEHLQRPQTTLCEIHRVLKTRGKLVLSTPNFSRGPNLIFSLLGRPRRYHGIREFTPKGLRDLLNDADFLTQRVMFSDWVERRQIKRLLTDSPKPPFRSIIWRVVGYTLAKVKPSLSGHTFIVAYKC